MEKGTPPTKSLRCMTKAKNTQIHRLQREISNGVLMIEKKRRMMMKTIHLTLKKVKITKQMLVIRIKC